MLLIHAVPTFVRLWPRWLACRKLMQWQFGQGPAAVHPDAHHAAEAEQPRIALHSAAHSRLHCCLATCLFASQLDGVCKPVVPGHASTHRLLGSCRYSCRRSRWCKQYRCHSGGTTGFLCQVPGHTEAAAVPGGAGLCRCWAIVPLLLRLPAACLSWCPVSGPTLPCIFAAGHWQTSAVRKALRATSCATSSTA